MKTSELLRFYQDGWRDFSGINLQGANLAGQDLSGANFSDCQIQGANFRGANLTGAKFVGAISGLQGDSDGISGLILLSVNFIYSLCSAFIGYLIYWSFQTSAPESIVRLGLLAGCSIIPFGIIFHSTLRENSLAFLAITEAIISAVIALSLKSPSWSIEMEIASIVGFAIFLSMLHLRLGTLLGLLLVAEAMSSLMGVNDATFSGAICVVMVTLWLNVLAYFMGYFTLTNQSNFLWTGRVRNLLLTWISIGGTSFYKADLTDADFSDADVKNTNFQKAILTGTCWRHAWNVHLARFDRSVSVI